MSSENEVIISSIEDLDNRHKLELDFYEAGFQTAIQDAVNKKRAKKDVKKQRDAITDRHETEKGKFLFSEDDQIILEKLNLNSEEAGDTPKEATPEEEIKCNYF